MNADQIIKEYKKLDSMRASILTDYDKVARYVLPSHAYFLDTKAVDGNQEKHIEVYDTTAMRANEVLAAFLHSAVTPPNASWFNLRVRDDDLNKKQAVSEYLENQRDKIIEAIQESNFTTSVAQFYLDLGAFNTAAISVFDESTDLAFGRLKFTNMHLSGVVFREGISGAPEFVWHKVKMSAVNALAMYPDASMPKVKEAAESDNKRFKEFDFIVYSEPTIEKGAITTGYKTCVVSVEDKVICDKQESAAKPFLIARFQQATGQVWGTGPGLRALPDILTINRAKELELAGWEEDINGGFVTTPDNLIDGEIDRRGVTMTRNPAELRPLREGGVQWNIANLKGEEMQNAIRSMFYEDRLVMQSSGGDTATEFRIRYDLLQRQLAPTAGRLTSEFLNPLVERVFDVMMQGGALDPLPPELEDQDLDIEFVSPIASAQKMPEIEALQNWIGLTANMMEIYPQVKHIIDIENALREAADIYGVPNSSVRSAEEYQQAVQQEQQQMQEAANAAQNQGGQVQVPPIA